MAITTKARAKGLLRDVRALLADKTLPQEMSDALTAVATALRKKWSDLEAAAQAGADAEGGAVTTADAQEADVSHGSIEGLLRAAVRAEFPNDYAWVTDVFDTWFVYQVEQSGQHYKRSYVVDDQGRLTLGEPQAVLPTMVYLPVSEAGPGQMLPPAGGLAAVQEGAQELLGEIVPLVERAVRQDGRVPIKMIAPGWGSSGFYGAAVLQRDGPQAFPAGTQMFWNHATPTEEAERPEGNLSHLAAVTTATPVYQEQGPAGPGLYSEARVFSPYAQVLDELAPHIGVSIRGQGIVKAGEAEGRKGLIVEKLLPGRSVDFVTTPGAGGQVLSLFEAARTGARPSVGGSRMNDEEIRGLQEAKAAAEAELARLREALVLREARDLAAAELAQVAMPELTRTRLVDVLAARPVLKEGRLDVDAFKARIAETVKDELAYLAGVMGGAGKITGMGGHGGGSAAAGEDRLAQALGALGLSEAAAKRAAQGR